MFWPNVKKKVTHIDCIWITFRRFDKTLTHPCLNHRGDVFPSRPIILVYLQRMGKEGQTHLLLFIYYDCKGQHRNKKSEGEAEKWNKSKVKIRKLLLSFSRGS